MGGAGRLYGRVPLHVKREMVGARESSIAQLAVERFVPRVFSLVSRQLVAPSEPPTTVVPTADVGLLPGVGSQVGF